MYSPVRGGDREGGRSFKNWLPILLGARPRIENRQPSAIRGAANQGAQALFQTDDCLGHVVFIEAGSAMLFDISLARGNNGIARHGEGKLVDDHARELLAAYIDALPETRRRKQHRVRRFAKFLEQRSLRSAALKEAREINLRRDPFVK